MVSITQSTIEQTHDREVALVIPATGDATRLQRFIDRATKIFQARILTMVGSWSETLITLRLEWPVSTEIMLDELMKMPEVEKAEEKRTKIQDIPRQRIQVILGAGSTADDHKAVTLISSDADISTTNVSVDSQLDT